MLMASLSSIVATCPLAAALTRPQTARSCLVRALPLAARVSGDRAARRYIAERRREFAPGLMGFRRGPRLPPPSPAERRQIFLQRGERLLFALNPSRLLIRRLLRDHSPVVRKGLDLVGARLTPLELRTENFEQGAFQKAIYMVEAYGSRCARQDYGGIFTSERPRQPMLLTVNVTRAVAYYLARYRARFRYGILLRVRRVRFSLATLNQVYARISSDSSHGRLHLNINRVALNVQANRIDVGLGHPSRRAARLLRRRYGPAVHVDPNPVPPAMPLAGH